MQKNIFLNALAKWQEIKGTQAQTPGVTGAFRRGRPEGGGRWFLPESGVQRAPAVSLGFDRGPLTCQVSGTATTPGTPADAGYLSKRALLVNENSRRRSGPPSRERTPWSRTRRLHSQQMLPTGLRGEPPMSDRGSWGVSVVSAL